MIEDNEIKIEETYQSDLEDDMKKYIEHRIDVPDFDLYIQASIQESNVIKLSGEIKEISEILDWVKSNVQLVEMDDRVQLADETMVYGLGTALDRAILIKSILMLNDVECRIFHRAEETYVGVDGSYYNTADMKEEDHIREANYMIY